MKLSKIACYVLAFSAIFAACQNVDFKKTASGVPYKIFSKSSNKDSVKEGYYVQLNVVSKVKDSIIFNSYGKDKSFFLEVKTYPESKNYSNLASNIPEILLQSKKGDSIYIVQVADSLLKDPQMGVGLKNGERLITTIRVVEIFKTREETDAAYFKSQIPTKAEIEEANQSLKKNFQTFMQDSASAASLQKDNKTIEDFLRSKNINARKSEWGVYVEEMSPGNGPKPAYKQFTNVKYKGMHLSGEVFDEGVYPVQIGVTQVVPGFMFGITELKKGGKARIYIPSLLAYGQQGSAPKVAPNEILIFEMELLDISELPMPQQQQVPQQPQQVPQQPQGQ